MGSRSGRRVSQSAEKYQQRGTSTATSKADANPAQLYIISNQKLIAMPFCTTHPCRPQGYVDYDQEQENYMAQMFVTSAV